MSFALTFRTYLLAIDWSWAMTPVPKRWLTFVCLILYKFYGYYGASSPKTLTLDSNSFLPGFYLAGELQLGPDYSALKIWAVEPNFICTVLALRGLALCDASSSECPIGLKLDLNSPTLTLVLKEPAFEIKVPGFVNVF